MPPLWRISCGKLHPGVLFGRHDAYSLHEAESEVNRLLTEHPEHFICCEKYTMQNGFFDIESNCLGAWLGGYAGQYGIRFDACGWSTDDGNPATEDDQEREPFVKASGAMPIMEHVMLTGQTVIDGPETIPVEVSVKFPLRQQPTAIPGVVGDGILISSTLTLTNSVKYWMERSGY